MSVNKRCNRSVNQRSRSIHVCESACAFNILVLFGTILQPFTWCVNPSQGHNLLSSMGHSSILFQTRRGFHFRAVIGACTNEDARNGQSFDYSNNCILTNYLFSGALPCSISCHRNSWMSFSHSLS